MNTRSAAFNLIPVIAMYSPTYKKFEVKPGRGWGETDGGSPQKLEMPKNDSKNA